MRHSGMSSQGLPLLLPGIAGVAEVVETGGDDRLVVEVLVEAVAAFESPGDWSGDADAETTLLFVCSLGCSGHRQTIAVTKAAILSRQKIRFFIRAVVNADDAVFADELQARST